MESAPELTVFRDLDTGSEVLYDPEGPGDSSRPRSVVCSVIEGDEIVDAWFEVVDLDAMTVRREPVPPIRRQSIEAATAPPEPAKRLTRQQQQRRRL